MLEIHAGDVYVGPSSVHGRGVFAARAFDEGEVIECTPVLVVPEDQKSHLDWTNLWGYYFEWAHDGVAIALGFGSLYNHSWTPNARYEQGFEEGVVRFIAVRPVEKGEEITVNYTGDPGGRDELWFDAGPPPPRAG